MDATQLTDFNKILEKKGYLKSDFDLQEKDLTNYDVQHLYLIEGEVTVIRKFTKKEKTYKLGHGSVWPSDFEDDLKSGTFS
jgi:hypothetical protein